MARPTSMWLRAKPGLRVPYPENSYKYLEGDEPAHVDVRLHMQLEYWTRRIDHGEVDLVEAPKEAAIAPPAAAPPRPELGAPEVMVELPSSGEKKES
jgi:hypothetical protein